MAEKRIVVIGGGLAGTEAAWQAARRGVAVDLYEMRPVVPTPAHKTDLLAELVCSNSLKSERENTAPWLLKEELRRSGSLLLQVAAQCAVAAGQALAVDRGSFAAKVTAAIQSQPLIRLHREELREIPADSVVIVATGPLTSDALAESIGKLTGRERLFFYDSISPIVDAATVDSSKVFAASRYGRSLRPAPQSANPSRPSTSLRAVSLPNGDREGPDKSQPSDEPNGDYWNCPLNEEEYARFYDALITAESIVAHEFEDLNYFEGCLPIEELARRGRDTLRFGPMKPVGLADPRTGRMPHAVVQLRRENLRADSYNLVGFQNHLKFGEQKRIFRMIPGLEQAEFLRYGQMHRNTYINAPALLTPTLQLRSEPRIFFAGQICGVEGYVESIATGLLAGMHAARIVQSEPPFDFAQGREPAERRQLWSGHSLQEQSSFGEDSPIAPPRATALGSLCHYVSHADPRNYQPANITFDLLPPLCATTPSKLNRRDRHARQCRIALTKLAEWHNAGHKKVLPGG
ncbi:MAG: methylenetetrahydrofolate--tRNA-(uracil(54)-C(5))-methyltransferase (FADH(2)-oxidizing) TrmFO [Acidobacteria bacterium]|nr:methylenetetrahydrofolate--tRNA-(uracil(54)-C(5))-methyltransferase (FADH(2)-oxidizing) TrmFO [Acidobacteriota bacterium]